MNTPDIASAEYREFVEAATESLRRHLKHTPIPCAELLRFFRAANSYASALRIVEAGLLMISKMPDGIEKLQLAEKEFRFLDPPCDEIRVAAKDVAKLGESRGVNVDSFTRLITEPCLVQDAAHVPKLIASFKAIVTRLSDKSKTAKGKRRHRPASGLTDQQNRAYRLWGENEESVEKVAELMKTSRATVYGHLKAVGKKLSIRIVNKPRAKRQALPADKRGQLAVADKSIKPLLTDSRPPHARK